MSLNPTLLQAALSDDVRALAALRADVQAQGADRDANGRSLLHVAVAAGAVDTALWLIDSRAIAVDQADNQGETPLMRAAWLGQVAVVGALLEKGASLSATSHAGGTALHYAYEGGTAGAPSVQVLLDAGADPQAVDRSGRVPSSWASSAEAREEAAKMLTDGQVGGPAPRGRLSLRRR